MPKTFGLFPCRVTYVIDKDGVVRHVFASQPLFHQRREEAYPKVVRKTHNIT